jgi:hypothetical protein
VIDLDSKEEHNNLPELGEKVYHQHAFEGNVNVV